MAPTLFAYPGDEPTSLAAVAVELDEAGTRVERIIQAVTLSRSALKNSWNMQATALADADIGILIGGLPTVRTALDTAQTAVSTHQATLTRIRGEIDDLRSRYLQQDRIFDAAERDYIANSTRTDSAAVNQREHDLATGRAAVAAQQGIAEEYQALLTSANSSAQTCALALTTAWDPTGRSHSSPNGDKGMVLLAGAGISTANLNVLRINNEVAEAAKLATELDGMDWIDATDPATQQKIARLAEIWGRDGHSEIFATGFYNKLGADDTVDLLARIATFIQPNGPADSGPVDAALIHGLQRDMANGLALATDGIEYGSDGSLVDNVAGGVNPSWVTDLMEKGRSDVTIPWNDMGGIQVKGYVPLMATLASGSGFSAGVLRALGDDMKSVEEQYAADNHMDTGDTVWNSTAGARVRWDWSADGYDFPMGNDPFTSWTTAALNSGPAATTVLATDSNLLNHLVNDRSWMLRDSGNNMGPTQWLYRIADDDERLEGLSALGNALPTMVGQGALSPDSKQAFDNVIHALGSRDTNPRIGDSTFQATDWIAPELRPGLGDMLVLNADRINEVMANPDLQDASTDNDYYRVIADVAKDPALDSGGGTFIDRMMNAEKSVIDAQMRYNVFSPADLDAQSRLAATMAHGHDAQNVHVQQAADAAHNAKVSAIATAAQLAVDTSSTPLRWTKETYKLFGGDLVQTIAGNFMHDNSLAAVGDNADWSGALRESINISAADQWYANGFADLPAAGPDHHLLDSSGQPVPWSKLSADDKSWVTQNWPSGPENAPVRIASQQYTVFDGQESHLNDKVMKYPDGTGG